MSGIPFYWRLSSFYLFYFALLGALVPFWSLYLKDLGFSAIQIGLLMALPQLTKLVAPMLWGWLADRSGRRLPVIRFGNLCAAVIFSFVFMVQGFTAMALLLIAFSFFWNAVLAQFEVVTLETLGAQSDRYSLVRVWGSVGFILCVVGVGLALDFQDSVLVPWVVLVSLWAIWLSTLWLPDMGATSRHESRVGLWTILRQPPVMAFFACSFLMQMSHGPYYTFFTIYMQELGVSGSVTGVLWGLGVVSEVLLFLVMHRLQARFSLESLIRASLVLALVRWLMLAWLADHWVLLLLAQLLHAASFGSFHAAAIAWVHRAFGAAHAGQGQAAYSSIGFGAGWAVGAGLSGVLWAVWGGQTFVFAAGLLVLALLIAWRWLRPAVPQPT